VDHTGANPPKTSIAIIPARFSSSRLPGKALLEIAGKPMICWVVERTMAATSVSRVIVATDDRRIFDCVRSAGFEAVMTRPDHMSGTDRIAEVAETLSDADLIVNVQGDEPMIWPETIDRAVAALSASEKDETAEGQADMATTWEMMDSMADVLNPDVVKIVCDESGRALYFSRSPVPYPREAVREHGTLEHALENDPSLIRSFRKHTGLYIYKRDVLLKFTQWPQSELERKESLEQLRALEHGLTIRAVEATARSIAVDTLPDLERVRRLMSAKAQTSV
jgi:3-deoxy-manno-octulosonate cytidylyltransferase (CMP-KDO synthetase)